MYLNKIFFVRNYDFICMIMFNLTMKLFWYPANRGYSLVLWYSNQWELFIGTLIPSQWGFIHWYSDTQTNGGLFIGTLIPSQWGLFIGILISEPMGVIHWYSDTQPMRVIHWYSDAQSRGNSVTIVIRLLRIWITFEYLNRFESLKLHIWFWKCLSIWTILSH